MTPIKLTSDQQKKIKAARDSRHLVYVGSNGGVINFAKMKHGGGHKKRSRK